MKTLNNRPAPRGAGKGKDLSVSIYGLAGGGRKGSDLEAIM
jgi:hypothetical protein